MSEIVEGTESCSDPVEAHLGSTEGEGLGQRRPTDSQRNYCGKVLAKLERRRGAVQLSQLCRVSNLLRDRTPEPIHLQGTKKDERKSGQQFTRAKAKRRTGSLSFSAKRYSVGSFHKGPNHRGEAQQVPRAVLSRVEWSLPRLVRCPRSSLPHRYLRFYLESRQERKLRRWTEIAEL